MSLQQLFLPDLLPDNALGWPPVTLVACHADQDPARQPDLLSQAAPPEEATACLTWRSTKRRCHWLAGRRAALQVGALLGWSTDRSPVYVSPTSSGSPTLQQGARTLPVTITHSGDWALAAAAPGYHLGIDFEVGLVDQFHLTSRICAPGEAERHGITDTARPHEERRLALEHIWTLKEAILKAFGVGLIAELRHFEVLQIDADGTATFRAHHPLHEDIPHPLPKTLRAAITSFHGHTLAMVCAPA